MSGDARDDLPRVSLDSVQDWKRIRANFEKAVYAAFNERIASSELKEHKQLLQSHIEQFIHRTFESAKPNLRINGTNFDEQSEYEQDADQFDEALDRRVWSLSDQRLKWDLEIAVKRRGIPSEVETLVCDLVNQQRDFDAHSVPDYDTGEDIELDEGAAEDEAEVSTVAHDLTQYAIELQETLPKQLERTGRAKLVDAEIRSLRV